MRQSHIINICIDLYCLIKWNVGEQRTNIKGAHIALCSKGGEIRKTKSPVLYIAAFKKAATKSPSFFTFGMFPRYSVRKLLVMLQSLRESGIFVDRNVVLDEPLLCNVTEMT